MAGCAMPGCGTVGWNRPCATPQAEETYMRWAHAFMRAAVMQAGGGIVIALLPLHPGAPPGCDGPT